MVKRVCLFLLFCIIAFGSAPAIYAQETAAAVPDYKSYLVAKGGVFYPEGNLSNLNAGFNGELAYGYRFFRNVAVELSSGYFGATDKPAAGSVLGYPVSVKESMYAVPLTVAIKGIVPIDKQFELYGLAGTGAYFVHGSGTISLAGFSASASDNMAVWGGFLGAGVNYNITPRVFVGLEGKYLWTNTATLRGSIAGVPVSENFKIEGILGTANVGFRF
jgi:outer membrane protein W